MRLSLIKAQCEGLHLLLIVNMTQTCNVMVVTMSTFQLCYGLIRKGIIFLYSLSMPVPFFSGCSVWVFFSDWVSLVMGIPVPMFGYLLVIYIETSHLCGDIWMLGNQEENKGIDSVDKAMDEDCSRHCG